MAPDSEEVVWAEFRSEAGRALSSHRLDGLGQTFRVQVGGERLPVAEGFGCVELSAQDLSGAAAMTPDFEDLQLWVMPLVSGNGRFSVGMNAVPVADFCGQ